MYTYSGFTIERFVVGEQQTNCYLLTCLATNATAIIDPGDEGSFISEHILREKYQPTHILLTHGHFDHVLACLELKLNFNLPIFLHQADTFLLKNAQKSAEYWLKHAVDPVPTADSELHHDQHILIGKLDVEVIGLPGHTPGSVGFLVGNCLFTGDTLFLDGVGSTEHTYSNAKELKASVTKIQKIRPHLELFPGHGEVGPLFT